MGGSRGRPTCVSRDRLMCAMLRASRLTWAAHVGGAREAHVGGSRGELTELTLEAQELNVARSGGSCGHLTSSVGWFRWEAHRKHM